MELVRSIVSEEMSNEKTRASSSTSAGRRQEYTFEESVAASSALSSQLNNSFSAPEQRLSVLKYIWPKLAKETWKKNPCYRHVYREVLLALTPNDMRHALPMVMAPSLLLVDDYMTYNQRLGLACVRRIVVSVPTE
ncbi:hypothetical protein MRX96_048626 [Rhipicephalus microplus]